MTQENLNQFRQQIDTIDNQIIDLLKDRIEIVKQVGEHKKKASMTQSFIRAGREANMLRDLTNKIDGKFPAGAIATIWRMIISSSLSTEQNMSIATFANEKDNSSYWRAREYFGSFLNIERYNCTDTVIKKIASGETAVGVLPLDNEPWWVRPKNEKNDIFIFARIPFIEEDSGIPASLAIANVMPEATDDDISLMSVTTKSTENDILKAFSDNNLTANIIANDKNNNYLIEINKFFDTTNPLINDLEKALADKTKIRLMGAYAVPIAI